MEEELNIENKEIEETESEFNGIFHERDSHQENNIVDEVKDSFLVIQ